MKREGMIMQVSKEFLRDYFRLVITVAVMAFFIYFSGTKFNLIELSALVKTGLLISGIWLALLIVGKTRQTPIDIPLFLFIVVMLATSFTGLMPRQAFVESAYILIAFMLFYFVVGLIHRGWDVRIFSKAVLIIGGVFMILSWSEFMRWYLAWLQLKTGGFIPPYAYRLPAPNFICVILNVWVIFAGAHFIYARDKLMKILLGLYLLSAMGLIYLTSSRGGWLGLAGGLFIFALIFLSRRVPGWPRLAWRKLRKPVYLVSGLLVIAVLIAAAGFVFISIENQPTHGPIMSSRSFLWNPAFKAIAESPWIGNGPYAYIFYYLQENSVPNNQLFDYAHNIYLDTLASSGVIGLIVLLFLIYKLIKNMTKLLKDKDDYTFLLALGVLGGFSAFLVHGLFDSVHHTVPVSLWNLCILLAIPIGLLSRNQTKRSYLSLGIGVLLIPAMGWYIYSGAAFEKGLRYALDGELNLAIGQMKTAEKLDPSLSFIQQQTGILYAQRAEQTGDVNDLVLSQKEFEISLAADDSWSASDLNLGVIADELGDETAAEQYFLRAVELAPDSALNHWNLALFYEENGELEKAADSYNQCLNLDNRMILAEEWQKSDFRQKFASLWREEHGDIVAELEHSLARTTGISLAIIHPAQAEAPTYTEHYLVLAAQAINENRLDDAQRYLAEGQLVYTQFSESNVINLWLEAEIFAAQGEYELAANTGENALKAVIQPGLFGIGSYSQQIFGPVVYRRHELPDYFVPQVRPLPITAEWRQRMDVLSQWYAQTGNQVKQQYWQNELELVGSIES
jgi:O-antigen ligase